MTLQPIPTLDLPDARYTAAYEYCGYSVPMIVLRFCDKWIATCHSPSGAERVAAAHAAERHAILTGNEVTL